MSELLHVLEPSRDPRPESLKATTPPAIMPSVLTTRRCRTEFKYMKTVNITNQSPKRNYEFIMDLQQSCDMLL